MCTPLSQVSPRDRKDTERAICASKWEDIIKRCKCKATDSGAGGNCYYLSVARGMLQHVPGGEWKTLAREIRKETAVTYRTQAYLKGDEERKAKLKENRNEACLIELLLYADEDCVEDEVTRVATPGEWVEGDDCGVIAITIGRQ